ncbi:M48 family metalloprotease [Streptomyces sp. NPDC020800]|uniref:M48 family metalloprotease n=1 Tax=Streptomyces sp. NPDC020800 TaxID=3365092 RepID=UPI0037A79425
MSATPGPLGPSSSTGTAAAPAPVERPDTARALVSSPLPLPTTTRLVLLVLVAGAGASFATWWWLVLGRANWPKAQLACLPTADAAPQQVLDRFTGCVDDVRLTQSAVVVCGPLALLALAVLCLTAGRRLSLLRHRATPDRSSPLALRLAAVTPEGPGRRPELWVRGRRVGLRARAAGTARRPRIVADSHVFSLPEHRVDAIFRHELAHLRLRDVGRVRLAVTAWWLLLLGVTLPMGVALVRDPGLLGVGLLVRMGIVLVVVFLTLRAVLRVREHDADLAASADPHAPRGATAAHLGSALPPGRAERLVRSLGLATHPAPAARLAVLADPARTWGLSSAECLTTGIGAGLVFTDLTLLVAALMPGHTQLAYAVGGLLTGWIVAGVVTVAWWRAVAVGHRDASARRAAPAGAALGLGVFLGSQLAGRAAGDWIRDTGTVDGLATALSLTHVPRGQALALGAVLMAGGALFALWTTSLARALGATVEGPRSGLVCAAAAGLAGLLLAVPLGSWFLFARLTAARAAPGIRWAVLDTPWWVAGVATSIGGALLPLVAARRPPRPKPHGAVRNRQLALLATATVLVAAGAGWAAYGHGPAGSPTAHLSGPTVSADPNHPPAGPDTAVPKHPPGGPDGTEGTDGTDGMEGTKGTGRADGADGIDGADTADPTDPPSTPGAAVPGGADRTVPLDQLPVLPPVEQRTGALRANTALVCRALTLGGATVWTDPVRRADLAGLLGGLDDRVLRAASAVLLRDPTGPVDAHALTASVLRCDLYFRYGR